MELSQLRDNIFRVAWKLLDRSRKDFHFSSMTNNEATLQELHFQGLKYLTATQYLL
jgi:hypothetical protein